MSSIKVGDRVAYVYESQNKTKVDLGYVVEITSDKRFCYRIEWMSNNIPSTEKLKEAKEFKQIYLDLLAK